MKERPLYKERKTPLKWKKAERKPQTEIGWWSVHKTKELQKTHLKRKEKSKTPKTKINKIPKQKRNIIQ